jgi:Ca2+-binding RTX toxin-like protein
MASDVEDGAALAALAAGLIVEGTDGPDTLHGGAGDDILIGGNSNDYLFGYGGDDVLDGGNGADIMQGGDGDDILLGGSGNDRLEGGAGTNTLVGGAGDDTYVLAYGSTNTISDSGGLYDTLVTTGDTDLNDYAGTGIEYFSVSQTYQGQRGITVTGTDGDDHISGSGSGITFDAGAGNDVLTGADQSSEIYIGGLGKDIMDSGPKDLGPPWWGQHSGADRFDFLTPEDSAVGAERDVIYNFLQSDSPGSDRINLGYMDANANIAGNQAFVFIADAEFTGTAGELRVEYVDFADDALDYNLVSGDVDGDGVADFEIEVHTQFPNRLLTPLYDIIL